MVWRTAYIQCRPTPCIIIIRFPFGKFNNLTAFNYEFHTAIPSLLYLLKNPSSLPFQNSPPTWYHFFFYIGLTSTIFQKSFLSQKSFHYKEVEMIILKEEKKALIDKVCIYGIEVIDIEDIYTLVNIRKCL